MYSGNINSVLSQANEIMTIRVQDDFERINSSFAIDVRNIIEE